jgi:hypothetical protein
MESISGTKLVKIHKSPNEICAEKLAKLQNKITAEDRKGAMAEYDISYVTVSRYLNGKGANLVLGISLLNFFIKQINKRAKDLKSLCKNQEV